MKTVIKLYGHAIISMTPMDWYINKMPTNTTTFLLYKAFRQSIDRTRTTLGTRRSTRKYLDFWANFLSICEICVE